MKGAGPLVKEWNMEGRGREGGGGSIFFIGGTSGRLIPSNNTNIVGGRTRRLIKH